MLFPLLSDSKASATQFGQPRPSDGCAVGFRPQTCSCKCSEARPGNCSTSPWPVDASVASPRVLSTRTRGQGPQASLLKASLLFDLYSDDLKLFCVFAAHTHTRTCLCTVYTRACARSHIIEEGPCVCRMCVRFVSRGGRGRAEDSGSLVTPCVMFMARERPLSRPIGGAEEHGLENGKMLAREFESGSLGGGGGG